MSTIQIPAEAFAPDLLSKEHHDRLILDLTRVVKTAGVPPSAVWTRLSSVCDKEGDYKWVRDFRINEDGGMVYVGKSSTPIEEKMKAIVGAFLRNYLDARMMTVQDVIRRLKEDVMPMPTLLLIPNFCLDKADGGDIASWDVSSLLGMLIDRASSGKKTVVYISSWATLEKQYGASFVEHFRTYYATCTGKTYSPAKIGQYVEA
jgi:hypothetical protein